MRAIPAQRLLASHAMNMGATFAFASMAAPDESATVDPIVVFSPSMYLPAVIAKAEAIAKFVFGSADVLGVKRTVNELGILGVEADVMAIDGSPEGVLRSLLLTRASEQVFEFNTSAQKAQQIELAGVTAYYRSEGAPAVRGERDDNLSDESSSYEWSQE